jgi:hypothetical protein
MIEADVPSTEVLQLQILAWCARPTGGGHGLTIDDATQRCKGAKAKALLDGILKALLRDSADLCHRCNAHIFLGCTLDIPQTLRQNTLDSRTIP